MLTKLILIRHGETEWNRKGKYCGWKNISLNKTGKKQARKVQKLIRKEKFDAVYSSSLKRAYQTAKILFPKRKIQLVPHLRELSFGIFEGLTHFEIMQKHRKTYSEWLNSPSKNHIPKGEKFGNFRKRIIKALKKIARMNEGKKVAVVTHGGVIMMLLCEIKEMHSDRFWENHVGNGSVVRVQYNGKKILI